MTTRPLPPLGDDPTVSVIVPVRDAAATLPRTVEALLQPQVEDVVLAVAASDAVSWAVASDLVARHPDRIRAVVNPSGRTPDALNSAIAASRGEVIVRVDAHAVVPPGYVARAIETLRRTGAANVGGRQVPVATDGFGRAVAVAMASPLGSGGAAYRSGSAEGAVDTVYLGAFRREALEAVGGFDTRFTRNQDAELNLRLRRAGYHVWFDPELEVAYQPRATVRALARQYLEYGRWRRLTARIHPGSLAPRQLAPPAVLLTLLASAAVTTATRDVRPVGAVTAGYLGLLAVGATAASPRLRVVPATTAALAVMHLAWGTGFILGPPRGAAGGDHERA